MDDDVINMTMKSHGIVCGRKDDEIFVDLFVFVGFRRIFEKNEIIIHAVFGTF